LTGSDDLALARDLLGLLPHLGRVFSKSAREHSTLSVDRIKPLSVLAQAGPLRAGEFAERCYLTPAAVTHAVDALVADGLARREDDPADRRVVLLHVTAKGRRELARAQQSAVAALLRAVEDLDPSSRAALRHAVPKLIAVLARGDRVEERV
jgi:DNA-binding MarR family transcriptional regulator